MFMCISLPLVRSLLVGFGVLDQGGWVEGCLGGGGLRRLANLLVVCVSAYLDTTWCRSHKVTLIAYLKPVSAADTT